MSRYANTEVVVPLDLTVTSAADEDDSDDDELDWSFVDIDLEHQLHIIKGGRTAPIVMVIGGTLVLAGALFFGS